LSGSDLEKKGEEDLRLETGCFSRGEKRDISSNSTGRKKKPGLGSKSDRERRKVAVRKEVRNKLREFLRKKKGVRRSYS